MCSRAQGIYRWCALFRRHAHLDHSYLYLGFKSLSLSSEELTWLQDTCPYFTKEYLDYLLNYRFKPDQVTVTYVPNKDNPDQGQIEMVAEGPWIETILWETPLMALLSEIYFRTVDKDWVKDGQEGNYNSILAVSEADLL